MKIKRSKSETSYRNKLLRLSRLYQIKEIRSKLTKTRLTNKQIELLLKKNNVPLPKEVLEKQMYYLNFTNFSKVLAVSILSVVIFGSVPLFYNYLSKINSQDFAITEKNILIKKKFYTQNKKNITSEKGMDFYFQDDLELEDQENTVRLGASTLKEIFNSAEYTLKIVRKTKKVKPIYISILPSEIDKIENTKEKKEIFIKIILPLILAENEKIISERKTLFRILGKVNNTKSEKKWLITKLKEYKIKNSDFSELKIRMDIIPVSLAIAQAAKETGWGTSRFAKEGNALFGQWTYSDKGLIPLDQVKGDHKVMKFNVLRASVRAYKKNLNSHKVYGEFRKARAKLREQGKEINSLKLVKYLDKYAETGIKYTEVLEKIIKQNSLMDFDQAKLLPTKSIIKGNT